MTLKEKLEGVNIFTLIENDYPGIFENTQNMQDLLLLFHGNKVVSSYFEPENVEKIAFLLGFTFSDSWVEYKEELLTYDYILNSKKEVYTGNNTNTSNINTNNTTTTKVGGYNSDILEESGQDTSIGTNTNDTQGTNQYNREVQTLATNPQDINNILDSKGNKVFINKVLGDISRFLTIPLYEV